ncbi:YjdF family protein [Cohnella caldifontis]|uniref:YjdF family protein n=1 Tax=Cohnella caldifontis TaxID=3027471 RepID=UPI0023ECCB48|nr:YjdF family protein [Cohnella sp. YIM B05605]
MKLTVYHDGQFWVGVVEELDRGRLKAARHVFGPEPHDEEVLQFVRQVMPRLVGALSREAVVGRAEAEARKISPKRLARQASEETKRRGISTFAQEALKLEHEKRKLESRADSRQKREALLARKRELKVRKAKEKHRGH